MTHITCRLTAENRDQLGNPTLGNRVRATFTFFMDAGGSSHERACTRTASSYSVRISGCDESCCSPTASDVVRLPNVVQHAIRPYSCAANSCVKAKFHYTDPTGPDRTRTDPHGLFLETRAADPGLRQSPRTLSGPVGPV